nr:DUF3883 domain-containing protein [uncultured Flavobacterium sp.]
MRNITNQETIRKVLLNKIPKNQWLHITEIYRIFEQNHKDFKADDYLPLAEYNKQEQWKRNIRVSLRNFKLKDTIQWNGNEEYYFPDSDKSTIKNALLKKRNIISEEELWAQLEQKRITGIQGEEFVINYEKKNLRNLNLDHLAEKVKRLSIENVGNGYDILSYSPDGNEKFIEVKTTTTSRFEFEMSSNELKTAELLKENYYIYFIRNFKYKSDNEILIFEYKDLQDNFEMIPCDYTFRKI